ncbi:MAG: elongation factor P [Planctomycetes bacterium]|nr:elongation factor P [Planctomycetota bacterium]
MPYVTQLKKGSIVIFNNGLWVIVDSLHMTPGNKRGFCRLTIKNLLTGQVLEQKFTSSETLETAYTEYKDLEYSYKDDSGYVFVDTSSYDQITLPKSMISENDSKWLIEGQLYKVIFHEGKPIGLEFSNQIIMEVTETEPFIKGQTAARSYKPAKLSNGATVNVPPFVSIGDKIKVDPSTGDYIERVTETGGAK